MVNDAVNRLDRKIVFYMLLNRFLNDWRNGFFNRHSVSDRDRESLDDPESMLKGLILLSFRICYSELIY